MNKIVSLTIAERSLPKIENSSFLFPLSDLIAFIQQLNLLKQDEADKKLTELSGLFRREHYKKALKYIRKNAHFDGKDIWRSIKHNYIEHQGPGTYHAVSELVSNAADAVLRRHGLATIGQFGMGFFQILNTLSGFCDGIVYNTVRDGERHILEFGKKQEELAGYRYGGTSREESGTFVALGRLSGFSGRELDLLAAYLTRKFRFVTPQVRIRLVRDGNVTLINAGPKALGYASFPPEPELKQPPLGTVTITLSRQQLVIQDEGDGLDFRLMLTRLLNPRQRGERDIIKLTLAESGLRLYYPLNPVKTSSQEVSLVVKGIGIETLLSDHAAALPWVALDWPWLPMPESRDMVYFDEEALRNVCSLALKITTSAELGISLQAELCNALALAVRTKWRDDPGLLDEARLMLRKQLGIWIILLRSQATVIKLSPEFQKLERPAEKLVFLDELLFDFNPLDAGFRRPDITLTVRGCQLYIGQVGSEEVLCDEKTILLDEDVFRRFMPHGFSFLKDLVDTYLSYEQHPDETGNARLISLKEFLSETLPPHETVSHGVIPLKDAVPSLADFIKTEIQEQDFGEWLKNKGRTHLIRLYVAGGLAQRALTELDSLEKFLGDTSVEEYDNPDRVYALKDRLSAATWLMLTEKLGKKPLPAVLADLREKLQKSVQNYSGYQNAARNSYMMVKLCGDPLPPANPGLTLKARGCFVSHSENGIRHVFTPDGQKLGGHPKLKTPVQLNRICLPGEKNFYVLHSGDRLSQDHVVLIYAVDQPHRPCATITGETLHRYLNLFNKTLHHDFIGIKFETLALDRRDRIHVVFSTFGLAQRGTTFLYLDMANTLCEAYELPIDQDHSGRLTLLNLITQERTYLAEYGMERSHEVSADGTLCIKARTSIHHMTHFKFDGISGTVTSTEEIPYVSKTATSYENNYFRFAGRSLAIPTCTVVFSYIQAQINQTGELKHWCLSLQEKLTETTAGEFESKKEGWLERVRELMMLNPAELAKIAGAHLKEDPLYALLTIPDRTLFTEGLFGITLSDAKSFLSRLIEQLKIAETSEPESEFPKEVAVLDSRGKACFYVPESILVIGHAPYLFFIHPFREACTVLSLIDGRKLCRITSSLQVHPLTPDFNPDYFKIRIGMTDTGKKETILGIPVAVDQESTPVYLHKSHGRLSITLPDRTGFDLSRAELNTLRMLDCRADYGLQPEDWVILNKLLTVLMPLPEALKNSVIKCLTHHVQTLAFKPTLPQWLLFCFLEKHQVSTLSPGQLDGIAASLGLDETWLSLPSQDIQKQMKSLRQLLDSLYRLVITPRNYGDTTRLLQRLARLQKEESVLLSEGGSLLNVLAETFQMTESGVSLILKKMQTPAMTLPSEDLRLLAYYVMEDLSSVRYDYYYRPAFKTRHDALSLTDTSFETLIFLLRQKEVVRDMEREKPFPKSLQVLDKAAKKTSVSPDAAEKIRGHIHGIITGQSSGDWIWIREVLQNSRDAIQAMLQQGLAVKKRVDIRTYYDAARGEWMVSIRDYAGVAIFSTFLKYFLIYDTSGKTGIDAVSGRKMLGKFGKGLYTLYEDADSARLSTGSGGNFYSVELGISKPGGQYRLTTKKLYGYENAVEQNQAFQGTLIERGVKISERQIPLYLLKLSVFLTKYAVGFDPDELEIYFNDQQTPINRVYEPLEESTLRIDAAHHGKIRVFLHSNDQLEQPSIVTIGGSFLTRLTTTEMAHYCPYLPKPYAAFLLSLGRLKIDLPACVALTSTRTSVLEKHREPVQKALTVALLKTMVALYRNKGLAFPGLPEDLFLDSSGRYAQSLRSRFHGLPIKTLLEQWAQDNYETVPLLTHPDTTLDQLTSILIHLPAGGDNGSLGMMITSLHDSKKSAEKAPSPTLPETHIAPVIARSPGLAWQLKTAYKDYKPGDTSFDKTAKREDLTARIRKEGPLPLIVLMEFLNTVFQEQLGNLTHVQFGYYAADKPEQRACHFEIAGTGGHKTAKILIQLTGTGETGWHLQGPMEFLLQAMIDDIKNKKENPVTQQKLMFEIFNLFVHEFCHVLEGSDHIYSHQKKIAGGSDSFETLMKDTYKALMRKTDSGYFIGIFRKIVFAH